MLFKRTLFSALLFGCLCLSAQESNENYPTFKVDGTLKNKVEYASETNNYRFSVRNSRLGVGGYLTPYFSYKGQLELSNNGNFDVLDLSAAFEPIKGLAITLGQTSLPLYNSYITSPSDMMFANRAFLGKYLISTRDLGMRIDYSTNIANIPTKAELGIFNGNTINDPVWRNKVSVGGRLTLGDMEGLRGSAKFYDYQNQSDDIHHFYWGADLRYQRDNWKVETEFMKRNNVDNHELDVMTYYVQGAYAFALKPTYIFKSITPTLRWDAIDQQNITSDDGSEAFDVNRLTVGVNLGITESKFSSSLRFNYEWYLINNDLSMLNEYREMDSNKFTMELLLTF